MANTMKFGEAGVLRVMSELLFRDHKVYRPLVDDHGVDLILSTGARVQVKTSKLWKELKRYERAGTRSQIARLLYNFTLLPLGHRRSGRVTQHENSWATIYDGSYDFLVLFGVDEQRFWIIPEFLARGRKGISLGPKVQPTAEQIASLFGYSQRAIAEKLGCSHSLVGKRQLRGNPQYGKWTAALRTCEDRWDLLVGSTVHQLESALGITEAEVVESHHKRLGRRNVVQPYIADIPVGS